MKNISIILFSILIGISIGCSKKDFPREETLINIYYENKELLNSIKDGFFSSGYSFPNGYYSIILRYDYKNKQLFCTEDPLGEKLQSIQNVHSDAIEYFTRINKDYARIGFRKGADNFIGVRFTLNSSIYRVSIIYASTSTQESMYELTVHIEDNWYVLRYIMP